MRTRISLWLALSSFIQVAIAQEIKVITGKVTDKLGNGMPGVSIMIKEKEKGTTTDVRGEFRMELYEDDKILVVSSAGYDTQEIVIGDKDIINISMLTKEVQLQNWCCLDHPSPIGPHCGVDKNKLKRAFSCTKFKAVEAIQKP